MFCVRKRPDFFCTQYVDFTEPYMAIGAHLLGGLWDGLYACSGRVWAPTDQIEEGKRADYIPTQTVKTYVRIR